MKLFAGLRVIAWLKRIALALEEANQLTRVQMGIERPAKQDARKWKAQIGRASVEQLNEKHRKEF